MDGVIRPRPHPPGGGEDPPDRSFSFVRDDPPPRRQRSDHGGDGDEPPPYRKDERGKYSLLPPNVTLDHKNAPEFTATPGLGPSMEFLDKAKCWWTDNDNKVTGNVSSQFISLYICSQKLLQYG